MPFATSQQLNKYYDLYRDVDVTFSKEVIQTLNFDPKQTFIRCSGGQWTCVLNSASMIRAKIICGKKSGFVEKLSSGITTASLRFSFYDPDAKDIFSFFVNVKVIGISAYHSGSNDLILISFEYTQRAPDALIEKLGTLLEANINATKRAAERLVLSDEIMRKICLLKKETFVFVDGIPRRCILRDISFTGAKIFMVGVASFLTNKLVTLKFEFFDPQNSFGIKGRTIRAEQFEDRKDLVALGIEYDLAGIPMVYKMYLNRYFSLQRKPDTEEFIDFSSI